MRSRALSMALAAALGLMGCRSSAPESEVPRGTEPAAAKDAGEGVKKEDPYLAKRKRMVSEQIALRGVKDAGVLAAMEKVPRHEFVPERLQRSAYVDSPLPIGRGQTISQPYIVALMTELVAPHPDKKALDVGTGSGYQAAVLAETVGRVLSVEIVCELADEARARLDRLGYDNVTVRCGDGYAGWPEEAPFDIIVVAAAPAKIPPPLIEQLAPRGKLVIPVGERVQELILIEKDSQGQVRRSTIAGVRFVPMTGRAEDDK